MKKVTTILPGLIISLIIMFISKKISLFVPTLGSGPIAIFLGILFGNSFFKHEKFDEGSRFSETTLLSISIVLLGGTITFDKLAIIGVKGSLFIVFQLFSTLLLTIIIGKKLGFSQNFTRLMASGNAVCGSSAIGAVSPIIDASSEDKALSITIVNLVGTVLLFLLPFISSNFFHLNNFNTSAMIGGILQSVGQVVASGAMVNDTVLELATIFKIVRIILLVCVVYIFSRGTDGSKSRSVKNTKTFPIPWYIFLFFIFSLFTTVNFIPEGISTGAKKISNQLELIALGAIGMRVKIKSLLKQGPKASLYGLIIGFTQIILAMVFLKVFQL